MKRSSGLIDARVFHLDQPAYTASYEHKAANIALVMHHGRILASSDRGRRGVLIFSVPLNSPCFREGFCLS